MTKRKITSKPYHTSKRKIINYYVKSTNTFHFFRRYYLVTQKVLKFVNCSKTKYRKYRWSYGFND